MIASFVIHSAAFQQYIAFVRVEEGRIRISGWIFHPTIQIDRVSLEIDGHLLAEHLALVDRPDVLQAFPQHPTSLRSGYELDVPFDGAEANSHDAWLVITPHAGGETAPVVLAGPTCDSADILYEKADYRLPLALKAGDKVIILSTGAYTTTYSSIAFNGMPPLASICI